MEVSRPRAWFPSPYTTRHLNRFIHFRRAYGHDRSCYNGNNGRISYMQPKNSNDCLCVWSAKVQVLNRKLTSQQRQQPQQKALTSYRIKVLPCMQCCTSWAAAEDSASSYPTILQTSPKLPSWHSPAPKCDILPFFMLIPLLDFSKNNTFESSSYL